MVYERERGGWGERLEREKKKERCLFSLESTEFFNRQKENEIRGRGTKEPLGRIFIYLFIFALDIINFIRFQNLVMVNPFHSSHYSVLSFSISFPVSHLLKLALYCGFNENVPALQVHVLEYLIPSWSDPLGRIRRRCVTVASFEALKTSCIALSALFVDWNVGSQLLLHSHEYLACCHAPW